VAAAVSASAALPGGQHDFPFELLGLVAFSDPVRTSAPGAVAACRRAGIRTVMITGDYPRTAQTIAVQVGLGATPAVVTGDELERLDDDALSSRVGAVDVYARILPEQKLRLVHALQARGDVVAMTGDGVNDAPALVAADVGVAMGARGTDVAREAADLVVLDDDFASIAQAVRLGRRVDDNIRKAMAYVIAVHVPIAGLALLPVALGWPLVLLPIHIVFLELIIDPACTIVFEAESEEPDVMDRPPRSPDERLLTGRAIRVALTQGALAFALAALVLFGAVRGGYGADRARAVTFTALVGANLALILTNRSATRGAMTMLRVPNAALWRVVGGATAILAAALFVPPVRAVFRFAAPSALDLVAVAAIIALAIVAFDAAKRRR
jgi:Ca2+-transporting ATPase